MAAAQMPDSAQSAVVQAGGDCQELQQLHIYFGSQTGTAEGFARDLGDDAASYGMNVQVHDLEGFCPRSFASDVRVAIFILATAGEGEPTDNAAGLHRWMLKVTPEASLTDLTFAVFGLGDRTHANFNPMGKLTDGAMERLGGRRLCKLGEGDDSDDIVRDFQAWTSQLLWPALEKLLGVSVSTGGEHLGSESHLPDPVLRVSANVSTLPPEGPGKPADVLARFYFQAEQVRVTGVSELRQSPSPEEGLSTVQVDLDLSAAPGVLAGYVAAGTLELLPENSPQDVAAVLPLLGISEAAKPGDIGDLDCCITFVPVADGELRKPFPTPCSLRHALTRYCDLRRAPTRQMLTVLQPTLQSAAARERVARLLADRVAMRLLQHEALAVSQVEFWAAFGVERLDLSAFLLHCPRQRPRPFTVASSPLASSSRLSLCVSLTSHLEQDPSPLEQLAGLLQARGIDLCQWPERPARWFGLGSKWLCTQLRPGDSVLARIRPSASRLPSRDVPVMMVAAGAGVAPFRAFWQELSAAETARTSPAVLFFGCRHPDIDWIYRSEMTAAAASKPSNAELPGKASLAELAVAFSRRGEEGIYDPSGCCGEHVQDQLSARGAYIRSWFQGHGVMYICGSNQMAQGVLEGVSKVLEGGDLELQRLKAEGQVVVESWGEAPKLPPELAAHGFRAAGQSEAESQEAKVYALSQQLLEAVKCGNHSEVDRTLAEGADANFQAGSRKYTRIGLRQEVGETALHWAALRGDE
ncbi:unnamed protein product, partial [Polarella glacialis]